MKKLLLYILILISLPIFAQQDPQYNMYMFNPLAINPAYAGSRDALSIAAIHRSQWVGFEGAPTTQNFAIHSPIANNKMGVGLQILNDKIGPNNTLAISADYAYKIRFDKGNLALGLRGSLYNYQINWSEIEYKDSRDNANKSGKESFMIPSFDFGMYYSTAKSYIGIEAAHLSQGQINLKGNTDIINNTYQQEMQLTLTAGHAFKINDNVVFKPSILFRTNQYANFLLDINASVLLKNKLWVGASYRKNYGVAAIFEYYITEEFRVGYSYDFPLNKIATSTSGSHEIFLGLDLNIFKSTMISPRYF